MRKVIFHVNNNLKISASLAYTVELLSSFQIIGLIFETLADSAQSREILFTAMYKIIPFFTGTFQIADSSTTVLLIKPLWALCALYIFFYIFLIILTVLLRSYKERILKKLTKMVSIFSLLHSRVFCFVIMFFLLRTLDFSNNGDLGGEGSFYNKRAFVVITIIICCLNVCIAVLKEFILYQVNKNRNFYAVKTNIYHQTIIIYKSLGLLLYHLSQRFKILTQINAVLHLLFSLLLLYLLRSKLPFYKLKMLKLSVIMAALITSLSFICILHAFIIRKEVLESLQILLLVLPGLLIKSALYQFKALFQKILRGEFTSPEHSVHFAVLFKELILVPEKCSLSDRNFLPNIHSFIGILAHKEINLDQLKEPKPLSAIKFQLYEYVVERLGHAATAHPNSYTIPLFAAEIYLKKLGNALKALELIKRVDSHTYSIPFKSSINSFYQNLSKVYATKFLDSDTQMELTNYFKYSKIANGIKMNIVQEINKHLDFWQGINKNGLDGKKTFEKSEEIDRIWLRVQKECNGNIESFRKHFPMPLLMYAIYLNNVRQLPYEAKQVFIKYKNTVLAEDLTTNVLGVYSGQTAVVIIAIDRQKLGEIIDASGSIQSLFGCKKKEVIGKNFACLFPTAIAKCYQAMIHEYAKSSAYKLDYKNKSFGKTLEGDLFEVEAHFQLYPYLNKEMTIIVLLKKLSDPKLLLIANQDGGISDCSKSLQVSFRTEGININTFRMMQDISYEFEHINTAFNMVYSGEEINNQTNNLFWEDTKLNKQPTTVMETFNQADSSFVTPQNSQRNSMSRSWPKKFHAFYRESTSTVFTALKTSPITEVQTYIKPKATSAEFTLQEAQRICEKFTLGRRMVLNPVSVSPLKKGIKLKANVQIKPYLLGDTVYKIVTLTQLTKEKFETYNDLDYVQDSGLTSSFAEEFPEENERNRLYNKSRPSNADRKFKALYAKDTFENPKERFISLEAVSPLKKQDSKYKNDKGDILRVKEVDNEEKSSVFESHHRKMTVAKTLKHITSKKKIHPYLLWAIIVVYLVIFIIANLIWVNYYIAGRSVEDIEKGIGIVNTATSRLQKMINVWLYGLILYQQAVGVQRYPDYIIQVLQGVIGVEAAGLTKYNNELKNKLSLIDANSLLQTSFAKEIDVWLAGDNMQMDHQVIDSFLANDILVSNYLSILKVTNIDDLANQDWILSTFNNTANDYLVFSNHIISETENFLQSIIAQNMTALKLIMAFEVLALLLFAISLIVLGTITIQSYRRLFRALVRTQEHSVSDRIAEIKNIKAIFDEDVEAKSFYEGALGIYEDFKPKKKVKRAKRSYITAKDRNFVMKGMNIDILKSISFGMSFLPVFAGLFIMVFINSISIFRSFESHNQKVSVLSQASYQGDYFVGAFLYEIMFQNRTDMLLFNQAPKEQLLQSLNLFKEINEKLSFVFLSENGETFDPIIESFLKNTVCEFLNPEIQVDCQIATKGGKMGLLGVNAHYHQSSVDVIDMYHQDPTFDNAKKLLVAYNIAVAADVTTVKAAYPFLISCVLNRFSALVQKALDDELLMFIGISVTLVGYAVFLHIFCLKKIRNVDVGRRRILKIVPYQMIQENRALSFYLIKDFEKEVGRIRNML